MSGFFCVCKEMSPKTDTQHMQIQLTTPYFLRPCQWGAMAICVLAMTAGMAKANAPKDSCWVADFREMALTTHNVQERERKAVEWLRQRAGQCNEEQLLMISSNRPSWMGNADSARVAAQIDRELEKRYLMNQRDLSELFDSEYRREETTQIHTTPAAPQGVVPNTQNTNFPAAVVVQQPAAGS